MNGPREAISLLTDFSHFGSRLKPAATRTSLGCAALVQSQATAVVPEQMKSPGNTAMHVADARHLHRIITDEHWARLTGPVALSVELEVGLILLPGYLRMEEAVARSRDSTTSTSVGYSG